MYGIWIFLHRYLASRHSYFFIKKTKSTYASVRRFEEGINTKLYSMEGICFKSENVLVFGRGLADRDHFSSAPV
jgi:hypothetical protein